MIEINKTTSKSPFSYGLGIEWIWLAGLRAVGFQFGPWTVMFFLDYKEKEEENQCI